jgi:glycerol-3-phosphate O-acyltransferase / dihydroxyacetone phosphate acyltransferase
MKWSLRHQSEGILYTFFERFTPWMLINHCRSVHVHNRQAVATDAPVLIAANHPTAFVDPVVIGRYAHPPIYNMTRGDIFEKKRPRRILRAFNMFPVFRSRDGYTDQHRNDEVFDFCVEKMAQKRVVGMFVEGMHHADKRIGPIQKGLARIAFPAYEQHRLDDLQVLPVGVAYWYTDRPRDVVFCNFGQPLYLRDYWAEYQTAPAAATKRLCDDIRTALQRLAFHINDPADDDLAEYLLALHRSEHPIPIYPTTHYSNHFFLGEKAVLDRLNALPATEKQALRGRVEMYFKQLKINELTDFGLRNPQAASGLRGVGLLLGALPALLGCLGHLPLEYLAEWVTRTKIKKREFKSSIYLGVEHFGGLVWYGLWLLVSLFTFNPFWIALAGLLPVLGVFSLWYRDVLADFWSARKARRHALRSTLLAQRAELRHR